MLIKLGADTNAVDIEGNTPLHRCIISLAADPMQFDKVKVIIKELLFSGASRSLCNSADVTPRDLF